MLHLLRSFKIFLISLIFISCESVDDSDKWVSLFDGKSLDGWEMKISGYELNDNYRNTFRKNTFKYKVKDSIILQERLRCLISQWAIVRRNSNRTTKSPSSGSRPARWP